VARRKRILIVDPHDDAREALRSVLEISGHEVQDTAHGTSALALALTWQPDVVCFDLSLADTSAFEVARQIAAAFGPMTPLLVAVTGFSDEVHRRKANEAGFDAYILKPYEIDELLDLLAGEADRHARARRSATRGPKGG
jgi:CheY-like chemotaxis protein